MNETDLTIIIIGGIISGVLGSILRWRRALQQKSSSASTGANNRLPVRSIPAEAAPKPTHPRRALVGFVVLCLLMAVLGLTFGFLVGLFSNLLYLVFVFPFVIGLGAGSMVADLVEKAKIRQPARVVILSVVSAVAIYGMLHYGRYTGFVVSGSLEISSDLDAALEVENLSVAKAFLDYALEEETGHPGFVGYMLYKANQGISIGRLTRSSSFNLGPVLTWLYWLLEFGIILGVTVQKGKMMLSSSYCESCGNWYGGEKHLGGTAFANESFLFDLIRQKDFSGLGKLMEQNADLPSLEVYFQGCQVCGKSQSQLVVRHAYQGTKGLQFRDTSQTILQPTESSLLLSQLSFSGD